MKSILYSRFLILLPWVLIVIIVIDIDTKRSSVPNTVYSHLPRIRSAPPREEQLQKRNRTAALPFIYAITPTYRRLVQKAELTRVSNTLRQVPNLHWIVVEDAPTRTELVSRFLEHCPIPHTHLNVYTPARYKWGDAPRGTEQRNKAISWLRKHRTAADAGVVFFADDDNTYSLELFEEMRYTRGVSVWPVGLVGGRRYERPILEKGKVAGWYTGWGAKRPFAIDMAGFAVNLQVILSMPHVQFIRKGSKPGMQETEFLQQIVKMEDLEPKASNCTQVLVWHTRTEKVKLHFEPRRNIDNIQIEV